MQQVLIVTSVIITIAVLFVVEPLQQESSCTRSQIISEPPTLVLLDQKPINFLTEITARKNDLIRFGIQILVDHNGNKVSTIEEEHKSLYSMAREICRQWLAGKGKQPVSWETLISVLEQIQLNTLATKIRNSVSARETTNLVLHQVEDMVKYLRERYTKQQVIIIWFDLLNIAHHTSFLKIILKMDDGSIAHVPQWQNIFQEPRMFDSIRMPRRLLITGCPGAGKTTLLRYLAK